MKKRNPVAKHAGINKGGPHTSPRRDEPFEEDYLEEEEPTMTRCPMCGTITPASVTAIGVLGSSKIHRCRACGIVFTEI